MKHSVKIIFALVMALLALLMAVSSCTPQSALTATVVTDIAPTQEPVPGDTPAAPVEDDAVILPGGPGPAELEAAPEGPLSPGDDVPAEPAPEEAMPLEPAPEEAPFEPVLPERSALADMTPAERAAAWGLPAPPEGVDLSGREFKLANAYNSITDQRPNHAYGAGVTVDEVSADAFNRFVSDAQAAGYGVTAWRGYIDYWTTLENYYEPAVFSYGAETASKTTFVPGCHDHQTALCIDLRYNGSEDFRGTEAWDWLITHCADYGIILRYPEGQESWYGTACTCPCHFRYVGVEPARYITDNNITLEQFMLLYDWDVLFVPGVN
jgi:LAS superfamily LD-carboxypeptidase LdcB